MKKFIAFAALNIVTTLSFASYCDNRPSAAQVANCWSDNVRMQNAMINQTVRLIVASPKLSKKDKSNFQEDHQNWINWVNQACSNDRCMYEQLLKHRNVVDDYYVQYAK